MTNFILLFSWVISVFTWSGPSKHSDARNQENPPFELLTDSTFSLLLTPLTPTTVHAKVWKAYEPLGDYGPFVIIYSFSFFHDAEKEVLTTFADTLSTDSYPAGGFKFVDANFDGVQDIAMASSGAGDGYTLYAYALFDTTEHQFKFSDEFSALGCCPEFDASSKTINVAGDQLMGGGIEDWSYTYKVVDNFPVAIEERFSKQWQARDSLFYHRIVRKLRDGEMKVVTDTTTRRPWR